MCLSDRDDDPIVSKWRISPTHSLFSSPSPPHPPPAPGSGGTLSWVPADTQTFISSSHENSGTFGPGVLFLLAGPPLTGNRLVVRRRGGGWGWCCLLAERI